MQVIIVTDGTPEEIAALVLKIQERQDISAELAEKFHQHLKDRLAENQAPQASH